MFNKKMIYSVPETGWSTLPQDLIGIILSQGTIDWSAETARAMSQVCREWRSKILMDNHIMESIKFSGLRHRSLIDSRRFKPGVSDVPLLHRALLSSNVTACIVTARYHSSYSNYSSACTYWKIAAKKAHPEALAMLAFEYYAGRATEKDPEEAYLLFNRVCKILDTVIVDMGIHGKNESSVPPLMTEESCKRILQFSSHVVAILILDNEFMSPFDKSTTSAVKWLKKSQMHGCPEAGKLLQSMFRNGQY